MALATGSFSPAVEHHAHRRALLQARQPDGQHRIVRQNCADADQDGVVHRAHQMHALARDLAGDLERPAAGKPGLAVGGDRELERDMRAAIADAADMPGMGAPRLLGPDADIDGDAGRAQLLVSLRRRLPDWDLPAPTPRARCPAATMASAQGGVLP